jgi:hypothetical protein
MFNTGAAQLNMQAAMQGGEKRPYTAENKYFLGG